MTQIFKGFKQIIDDQTEGYSYEDGYVYFVRKSTSDDNGYLVLNGKKYGQDKVNLNALRFKLAEVLPTIGENNTIYLVPTQEQTEQNYRNEYIWINNHWELIGNTSVNLEDYATINNVNSLFSTKIGELDFTNSEYIKTSNNVTSALQTLDTALSSVDTLYELYKKCGGTLPEKVFPTFVKYFFTPFMISSTSETTIPEDLLNESKTNFINEYYWQICRITGGEPIKTLQWDSNGAPSRFQGMATKKEFTIDYNTRKITPV